MPCTGGDSDPAAPPGLLRVPPLTPHPHRLETTHQQLLGLWQQLHQDLRSLRAWQYLTRDIQQIQSWTHITVSSPGVPGWHRGPRGPNRG